MAPHPTTTTVPVAAASLYLSVAVGTPSGGSVPVTGSATLTNGASPDAGQLVNFGVGGGCSPASSRATTGGGGEGSVSLFCPVGAVPVSLSANGDGTQASTSFVPS